MRGLCLGGRGNVDNGIERKTRRGQAQFGAARLIAQLQRNVLLAQRSRCERVDRQAENHSSLIDVERLLREREGFQFSFGIDHVAAGETGRKLRLEIGRDEILFRLFACVSVKPRTYVHNHGKLRRATAARRLHRGIDFRLHHVAARRHLRIRCGHEWDAGRRNGKTQIPGRGHKKPHACHSDGASCPSNLLFLCISIKSRLFAALGMTPERVSWFAKSGLHTFTSSPSCCEITRLITPQRSSPVFSSTNAFLAAFHASLKLVESAEIQISRTGVFGEITNLASVGSSKITSSFPASPSTSKPCSSPSASRRFFRSSNAASAFR